MADNQSIVEKRPANNDDASNDDVCSTKLAKIEVEPEQEENDGIRKETTTGSVHEAASLDLSSFQMTRVLNCNSARKQIVVEGKFKGHEAPAVVLLEKKGFPEDEIFLKRGFFNEGTIIRKLFMNDVYGNYECFPTREHNGLNTTIIHPATQKHVDRFIRKDCYLVKETYEIYQKITLPCLEDSFFSLQWVDNILDHKAESDKIIYEDKDEESGFIMLPDLKWDGSPETLSVLVLARKRIKSLRELNGSHLPLLKNIRDTATEMITKKFNIPACQIRTHLHYQPTYYHLHVHFTYLMYEAPAIYCERAHLLDAVINNIEIASDYYQKAVLTFAIKEGHPLCKKYQESGVLTVINKQTENKAE